MNRPFQTNLWWRAFWLLILVGLAEARFTCGNSETSPLGSLPPFSLSDQSNRLHQISFPRAKPLLLIVVDRKASTSISTWTTPLFATHASKVDFEVVADVSPIPSILRKRYKKHFEKTLPHPVMLDWHGDIVKKLQFKKNVPNLFVVNRNGEITFKASGVADTKTLEEISGHLNALQK